MHVPSVKFALIWRRLLQFETIGLCMNYYMYMMYVTLVRFLVVCLENDGNQTFNNRK